MGQRQRMDGRPCHDTNPRARCPCHDGQPEPPSIGRYALLAERPCLSRQRFSKNIDCVACWFPPPNGFMDFPAFVSFTITNACNLRCTMCGQWSPDGYVRTGGPSSVRNVPTNSPPVRIAGFFSAVPRPVRGRRSHGGGIRSPGSAGRPIPDSAPRMDRDATAQAIGRTRRHATD